MSLILCAFAASLLAAAAPAAAGELPRPTGKVILTVTGQITRTNAPGRAEFDVAMLEALGVEELRTATAWTEGRPLFVGPRGQALLEAVGARGERLKAKAINDYLVTIPAEDFRRYPVLLALKIDGEYLRVRDKGPIWVVYPRDQHPELATAQMNQRWIWQLKELAVE